MNNLEYRSLVSPLEITQDQTQKRKRNLTGYAARYESMSHDLGGFKEVIKPGAFDRSITSASNIRALINHNPLYLLGTTQARTLKLSTDQQGLRFDISIPDTSYGRNLRKLVERGDVSEMSFSFVKVKDEWGNKVRRLYDVDLRDVSVLTVDPAYPDATSVGLRSLESVKQDLAQAEIAVMKMRLQILERTE